MLIEKSSPLRLVPYGWDRKETLYYDAIRYSVEMANMAYTILCNILLELTNRHHKNKQQGIDNLDVIITSAMLNAWSVVDSTYRLRGLLAQAPGIKRNSASLVIFSKKTENIEILRHIFQHLNNEIKHIVIKNLTVLGVLSWVAWLFPNEKWCYTCSIAAGSLFDRKDPFINPAGKSIQSPIDCITLDAGHSVNLSELMIEITKVTRWMEEELKKRFGNQPQAGADAFYSAEFYWE